MEKIHTMVDANTIIGTPIQTGDVTLIPVSRLSFGIASGGSDFTTKNQKPEADNSFGGGSGASAKLEPVAFLIIRGESVKLLPVAPPPATTVDRVIEVVPEVVDKVTEFWEKQQEKKGQPTGCGGIRPRSGSAGDKRESGGAYWTHPNNEVMGIETPSGRGGGPSSVSESRAHGPRSEHLRGLRHPDGGGERAGPL